MTEPFMLVEGGPIAGVPATVTYYDTRDAAEQYAVGRLAFFAKIELCEVLARSTTVMVPQTTVET